MIAAGVQSSGSIKDFTAKSVLSEMGSLRAGSISTENYCQTVLYFLLRGRSQAFKLFKSLVRKSAQFILNYHGLVTLPCDS